MATKNTTTSVIRLPAFIPNDPDVWFLQVEWILKNAGITSSREKFEHVGASLEPKYIREVRDLLVNPPSESEDPFSKLKEALLERLGQSQVARTRQLLEREDIGDRTPSQFLRHLQSLAGEKTGTDVLKVIWTNQLDPIVQACLATQPSASKLDDLAKIADNIVNSIGTSRLNNRMATISNDPQLRMLEELTRIRQEISSARSETQMEIATMKADIAAIKTDRGYNRRSRVEFRGRSPSRSSSRGRSLSRSSSRGPDFFDGICWYHHTFGDTARRCQTGCAFNIPNANSGNRTGSH